MERIAGKGETQGSNRREWERADRSRRAYNLTESLKLGCVTERNAKRKSRASLTDLVKLNNQPNIDIHKSHTQRRCKGQGHWSQWNWSMIITFAILHFHALFLVFNFMALASRTIAPVWLRGGLHRRVVWSDDINIFVFLSPSRSLCLHVTLAHSRLSSPIPALCSPSLWNYSSY